MGVIENEKGTAEIIGVLLLFMISLVILGYTQTNLVPDWNKNIEMQQFDRIHDEFLDIRSDIQDVYISNIPKTSSLSMGIRYPERYLLKNPGPGASGTLTYEPVNFTLKINSNPINYTSTRIIYKMNGISSEPELVYEYGLVITDFGGGKSFNESAQSLISGNDINIPVLFAQGQQSVGSMMPQSLTINALPAGNYTVIYNALTTVNITLPTRYPDLWKKLTKNISGVNVIGNGSAGDITITRNVTNLIYPSGIPSWGIYSGMITTQVPASIQLAAIPGGVESGSTGAQGAMVNEINANNRVNIPPSDRIQKFILYNITGTNDSEGKSFKFSVNSQNTRIFEVTVTMGDQSPPTTVDVEICTEHRITNGIVECNDVNPIEMNDKIIAEGINITIPYSYANINSPNSLTIVDWPGQKNKQGLVLYPYILYFRLVICDINNPC